MKAEKSGPTLASLDALSAAVRQLFVLFDFSQWMNYPMLLLMAATAWLIPIASIITPATLAAQLAPSLPDPTRSELVPNLDFRSLNFVDEMQLQDGNGLDDLNHYAYQGPDQAVLSTASAVMAGGAILPIPPPATNASWTLTFDGPSISCQTMNQTLHRQTRQSLFMFMNQLEYRDLYKADFFGYMAWYPQPEIPWKGQNLTSGAPFVPLENNGTLQFNPGSMTNTINLFTASDAMVNSYRRAFRDESRWESWYRQMVVDNRYEAYGLPPWLDGTALTCRLVNSTYQAFFEYENGAQRIDVKSTRFSEDHSITTVTEVIGPAPNGSTSQSTDCVALYQRPGWNFPPEGFDASQACHFDDEMLRTLSYQAIWDAFTRILQGSVHTQSGPKTLTNSSIVNTVLLNTPELAFLRNQHASKNTQTLQDVLKQYDRVYTQGLTSSYNDTRNASLADALEEMFRNVTVSLMASPVLQPNRQSQTAPPPIEVTLPTWRVSYVYTPWRLWLPYGIAIFLSTTAVTVGLVTILMNGASYSDSFSTTFRTTKGSVLSERLRDWDLAGHDPLPKHLAKARVVIAPQGTGKGFEQTDYAPLPAQDVSVDSHGVDTRQKEASDAEAGKDPRISVG